MASLKVKQVSGMSEQVKAKLKQLQAKAIHVGFLNGEMHKGERSDLTNAELAIIQEYGTSTIPSRPFASTSLGSKKIVKPEIDKVSKELIDNPTQSMNKLGKSLEGVLKDSIYNFSNPPNAESTQKKKGNNNPLIETGNLHDSVDYEIRKKGK